MAERTVALWPTAWASERSTDPAPHPRLPNTVGWQAGLTYKGDQGSQQQDAHQEVLKLLQHQLPQGLPWKQESSMRPEPLTHCPSHSELASGAL